MTATNARGSRFTIITGGPGAGKTSLIQELRRRGFAGTHEAGRAIIRDQTLIGGRALHSGDAALFAELMLAWEMRSYRIAEDDAAAAVFFDRGIPELTGYLRMLGFDTWYQRDSTDEKLAAISAGEDRILLTRDRGLLKRNIVTRGYFVQTADPSRQLVEVIQEFDLIQRMRPFRRCIHCNGILQPVPKEAVIDRLLPETRQYYDEFFLCPRCGHIYWKGSHYRRMKQFIESVIASS